jgi:hypothetical protein
VEDIRHDQTKEDHILLDTPTLISEIRWFCPTSLFCSKFPGIFSPFAFISLDGYVYLDSLSPHKWTEAVML